MSLPENRRLARAAGPRLRHLAREWTRRCAARQPEAYREWCAESWQMHKEAADAK